MTAQLPADDGTPADQLAADRPTADQLTADRPTADQPTADRPTADQPSVARIVLLIAVCIGVAALAAAAFVLSYTGLHVLALQAGVQPRLARAYPVMIDAMLVVALAAVLALRAAGLPSRLLAWVILLAVLVGAAGADAMRADGRRLPHHVAAITVALVPWALVLLAFVLLMAMLRHARLRRQADGNRLRPAAASAVPHSGPAPLELPQRPAQAAAWPRDADQRDADQRDAERRDAERQTTELQNPELHNTERQDPELPGTDSLWDRLAGPRWEERVPARHEPPADSGPVSGEPGDDGDEDASELDIFSSASAVPDDHQDPDMPVFHRLWSSPAPPAENRCGDGSDPLAAAGEAESV